MGYIALKTHSLVGRGNLVLRYSTIFRWILEALCAEWRQSTRFASTAERRNIIILNVSFPRAGIESITCHTYSYKLRRDRLRNDTWLDSLCLFRKIKKIIKGQSWHRGTKSDCERASQHAMSPKFVWKWEAKCLDTRLSGYPAICRSQRANLEK